MKPINLLDKVIYSHNFFKVTTMTPVIASQDRSLKVLKDSNLMYSVELPGPPSTLQGQPLRGSKTCRSSKIFWVYSDAIFRFIWRVSLGLRFSLGQFTILKKNVVSPWFLIASVVLQRWWRTRRWSTLRHYWWEDRFRPFNEVWSSWMLVPWHRCAALSEV